MPRTTAPVGRSTHVVVIGAGMGGLAAAHALSRHAGRVTVVERDMLPSQPSARSGTPQRWPGTEGGSTSAGDRLMRRYLDRVVAAAAVDPVVGEAFFDVVALLAEPTSLLRPALAARVLARRHTPPSATPPLPLHTTTAPARAA